LFVNYDDRDNCVAVQAYTLVYTPIMHVL